MEHADGLSVWDQGKKAKTSSRMEWPDDWDLLQNILGEGERGGGRETICS